jgi:predicted metal-dependent HD superfamily phosphohydrolase
MAEAEEIAHAIAERTPFLLAILFHTAIFDRRLPDAAARSVTLMRRRLAALPEPVLARAAALVLAVARQELPETEDPSLRGDAMLLLDMDNAPLGAPPAEHAAYEAALRAECAHMSEDRYAAGRAAALRMMLWRDRIFRNDRFFLALERRARANAERQLEVLGG